MADRTQLLKIRENLLSQWPSAKPAERQALTLEWMKVQEALEALQPKTEVRSEKDA